MYKTTNLLKSFEKLSAPAEINTRLKFMTLNQTIFEIELTTNSGELNHQIYDLVKASVEAAARSIISAK